MEIIPAPGGTPLGTIETLVHGREIVFVFICDLSIFVSFCFLVFWVFVAEIVDSGDCGFCDCE